MSGTAELDDTCFLTTDGDIAVINLESARRRSWDQFYGDPLREGIAETVVEHEQLTAQFVGDVTALDRLEFLVRKLSESDPGSARTALVRAQVTSMMHRFAEARQHLEQAEIRGAPEADVGRLWLSIDQASGLASTGCCASGARQPGNQMGSRTKLRWAGCWRTCANLAKPTTLTGMRFAPTGMFRRSPSRGRASNSACCGGNWFRSRK